MKACPYCGKQYPDDVVACPIDHQPLDTPRESRKKVTGVWRGFYRYEQPEALAGLEPVPFTLILQQGFLGHFKGTVTDDSERGTPGTGTIEGYFAFPRIEFTKQMPVAYVSAPDGKRLTLREQLIADGRECDRDVPHPPIFYEGAFRDKNHAEGIWTLRETCMAIGHGESVNMPEATGTWTLEIGIA